MNKRLVPPHSRSAHGTQSCTAYIIIRCTKKTKACRRRASSKTTESGNPPEARRAVGPTTRRSCCRRANHCPLMPALPPRQAHSCRPRPRPVLAPHPDAAAPNTEHRTRPSRGSGTPAPARRERPTTPPVAARAGRAQGIRQPATTGPAAAHTCRAGPRPHAHVILKVTSSTTQPRFRRTNRSSPVRKDPATPPLEESSRPHLPPAQGPRLRRSIASAFFLPRDLYACRLPSPRRCHDPWI